MYLKIDFCQKQELQYFYPGYVVPGYTPFEYKLSIGKASLQYLELASQQWLPFAPTASIPSPLQKMVEKLKAVQVLLKAMAIPNTFQYYRFFEANLNLPCLDSQLFDFPVFLHCFPKANAATLSIIVFDVSVGGYQLLQVTSTIRLGPHQQSSTVFEESLLKVKSRLFVSPSAAEMANFLTTY